MSTFSKTAAPNQPLASVTAAEVADLGASTTLLDSTIHATTAPRRRKLTLGNLASWIATAGLIGATITAAAIVTTALRGPGNVIKFGTDTAGVDAPATAQTLMAPLSTGAATAGYFKWQVGAVGAAGAVVQVPFTAMQLGATGGTLDVGPNATDLATYGEAASDGARVQGRFKVIRVAAGALMATVRVNTSFAAPSTMLNGDVLGTWDIRGWDTAAVVTGATVRAVVAENWTAAAHGAGLELSTTAPGGTTTNAKIAIAGAGTVTFQNVAANSGQISAVNGSLTGSNASTFWSYTGTWNTSGAPSGLKIAITDTASDALALPLNILGGAAATTVIMQVTKGANLGLGTAALARNGIRVGTTATGDGTTVSGWNWVGVLNAGAGASLGMRQVNIAGTFTPGSVASLATYGVYITTWSVAGFTTPGNVTGMHIERITATGATDAFAHRFFVPTGATNNYGLHIGGDVGSTILYSTGQSLTGSLAQSLVDLSGTWNTSGVPTAFKIAITNTASGAGTLLMNLLAGAAGTTSMFAVRVTGIVDTASTINSGGDITLPNGNVFQWGTRTRLTAPSASQLNITDNTGAASGIGFDFATDAVLKVRVRAQNADATLQTLQHWFTGAATAPAAGQLAIGGTQRTTIGANGGASALTANPLGFIDGYVGATAVQIPYYNRGA